MLKIGRINYLNLYPVFEALKKYCSFCKFIDGEPSDLNKKIFKGLIDISPSSSIEYLKNKEKYLKFDDFSVSSRKKILSVLLILDKPIEKVNNYTEIFLSPSSFTSNSLLKIIFYEFLNKKPKFQMGSTNIFLKKNQLIIGDNALEIYFNSSFKNFYIYDLAELWYDYTKLPFVFALWIINKRSYKQKKEIIEIFEKILKKCIRSYVIPKKYKKFTENQIIEYFQNIEYNFSEQYKKSLKLFERLSKKWKII